MIAADTLASIDLFVSRISARYEIEDVILYGSRARGTHRPDSDADVAVILRGENRRVLDTTLELADVAYDVLLETGINITPLPVWLTDWERPENHSNPALLAEIKADGIVILSNNAEKLTTRQRIENVEAALATTRLSGQKPSPKMAKLFSDYQSGCISADDVVKEIKEHYAQRASRKGPLLRPREH